jgi:hypothetical protein
MSRLFLGIAALVLLSFTLPASAAPRKDSGASNMTQSQSARQSAHKQRHRSARRHHARRHHARGAYVEGLYGFGGGYGGYVRMRGDPLGRNPAVEFYRAHGRCVIDEGYGRYTFCDD